MDVKDRHNGNVMIDAAGHLVHIDFGFVFGLAPGKQFSMEKAPWKLTEEWVDVMGGRSSEYFREYKKLCVEALKVRRVCHASPLCMCPGRFLTPMRCVCCRCGQVARTHAEPITLLIEIMTHQSNFPAFKVRALPPHHPCR